jgi:hypothetical protein
LVALLSLITCARLLLFAVQSSLAGWDWFRDKFEHRRGPVLRQLLWCFVPRCWASHCRRVRGRSPRGLILAVYFAAGFGAAQRDSSYQLRRVINLSSIINLSDPDAYIDDSGISPKRPGALTVFCGICVWLLLRRVRAFEVVK